MRLTHALTAALTPAALLLAACAGETPTAPGAAAAAAPIVARSDASGSGATVQFTSRLIAKCLDVPNASATPGTKLQLWGCWTGVNQQFTWTAANELRFGGLCVTASGNASVGSPIILAGCTGGAGQRWVGTDQGAITAGNGLCLDVPNANAADGQDLIVWTCHGGSNQLWTSKVVAGAPPAAPAPQPPPQSQPTGAWSQAPTSPTTWAYQAYPVPSGAVAISPGDNWQAKIDNAGAGATFVVKAGVHRRAQFSPKDGQSFIGEPGAVLTGEDVTLTAFDTRYRPSRNVTVRGLVIEHYATTDIVGAVQGDNATGWTVEGNEVRDNAGVGVRVGPSMRLLRNLVHHNGFMGVGGYRAHGAVLEGNEVSYNNTSNSAPDHTTGGAAGVKLVAADYVQFRSNYVHHNAAVGLWVDGGCYQSVFEYNTASDNFYRGIFVEISYDAVVRYNTAERNQTTYFDGWPSRGGVVVSASSNVEVYGNVIRDNGDGIFAFQAENRGAGPRGPYELNNLHVHDNLIRTPSGISGLGQLVGDASYWTGRNNRFANNTYVLTGNARPFFSTGNTSYTEAQWRDFGQDAGSTFTR